MPWAPDFHVSLSTTWIVYRFHQSNAAQSELLISLLFLPLNLSLVNSLHHFNKWHCYVSSLSSKHLGNHSLCSPPPSPIKYLSNYPLLPNHCHHPGLGHCNLLPRPLQLYPLLVFILSSTLSTVQIYMKHRTDQVPSKVFHLSSYCPSE